MFYGCQVKRHLPVFLCVISACTQRAGGIQEETTGEPGSSSMTQHLLNTGLTGLLAGPAMHEQSRVSMTTRGLLTRWDQEE